MILPSCTSLVMPRARSRLTNTGRKSLTSLTLTLTHSWEVSRGSYICGRLLWEGSMWEGVTASLQSSEARTTRLVKAVTSRSRTRSFCRHRDPDLSSRKMPGSSTPAREKHTEVTHSETERDTDIAKRKGRRHRETK